MEPVLVTDGMVRQRALSARAKVLHWFKPQNEYDVINGFLGETPRFYLSRGYLILISRSLSSISGGIWLKWHMLLVAAKEVFTQEVLSSLVRLRAIPSRPWVLQMLLESYAQGWDTVFDGALRACHVGPVDSRVWDPVSPRR
jgi:hypothetical protein